MMVPERKEVSGRGWDSIYKRVLILDSSRESSPVVNIECKPECMGKVRSLEISSNRILNCFFLCF